MIHKIIIEWYGVVASRTILHNYPNQGAIICILTTTFIAHIYVQIIEPRFFSKIKRK